MHDAIHIVLAEFNDLTSQRLKGTIDNSEATRRLNVIHDKILVALGAFDSGGRVLPGAISNRKKYSLKILLIVGLCITGFGFISQHISLRIMDNKELLSLFLLFAPISEWLIPFGLAVLGVWAIAVFVNAIRG